MSFPTLATTARTVTVILAVASALAQPPVAPDPQPKPITAEELNAVIGGPTTLTLDSKDARPEEIFGALAQQAGLSLEPYGTKETLKKLPPISVSIANAPFWVAIKNLAAPLGLSFGLKTAGPLERSPSGLSLQLQRSEDPQLRMGGPMLVRGPFVVIATSARRVRTAALGEEPSIGRETNSREEVAIEFVILGDPKLRGFALQGSPSFRLSEGWEIRSAENDSPWKARVNSQGAAPLEWRFSAVCKSPVAAAAKAPSLKATASGLFVTTRTEFWEVPEILSAKDLSKEIKLAEGVRRYTIHEVTPAPNREGSRRSEVYAVRLSVAGLGITKGRWSGWPLPTAPAMIEDFRLVDAEGRDFAPSAFELKELTVNATFGNGKGRAQGKPAVGPPAKALWKLPTEFRTVEIPIEITDLLLP